MAFTDNCDLFAAVHEDGINLVISRIMRQRPFLFPIPSVLAVLFVLRLPLSAQGPVINDRFPLQSGDELSPPKVSVVGECAKAVHVSDFLPHALVKVFANHTEQIGSKVPYFTDDDIPLTRELRLGEVVTATQTVHGFTSAESRDPVVVGPYPAALNKPVVEPDIWACGQVVPVNALNPGTHVNVFRAITDPLGDSDVTQPRQPVVTLSLNAGDQVTAIQTACRDVPAKVKVSPRSDPLGVLADPIPIPVPKVDPWPPGADAVTIHKVLVGSAVQVFDNGSPVGGGLAIATDGKAPVQPPAGPGSRIQAAQKLCTTSALSPPQGPTSSLPAPVIVTPVCEGTHTVTIQNTYINAIVVLFRNGSIFDMTGGTGGDLAMDLGDTANFQFGDEIQALQYVGSVISPRSNLVFVGCGNVITQHNDNARSGGYTVETQLTPANVRPATFGRLYTRGGLDGDIVAQPLYMRGVAVPAGGTKNLFFIATSKNNVYAFDADDLSAAAGPVWQRNLCNSVHSGVCGETYSGLVGITSTPVIDPISKTLYVVARCSDGTGGPQDGAIFIYALDITNKGQDRVPRVQINAVVGNIPFNFHCQRNRPGLLLQNGVVYAGFASFSCDGCDDGTPAKYQGWVIGYRAADLQQVAVFCTTPSNVDGEAGIWQTGKGLAGSSDGSIFFETGNGATTEPLQDSFVKLIPGGPNPNGFGLTAAGHFTPDNAAVAVNPGTRNLSVGDTDLGSGGPLLLPAGHLIGGGKQGRFYVLDQGSMNLTQNATPDALGYDGFQAFTNTYHAENSHAACPKAGGPKGCDPTGGASRDNQCFIDPIRYGDGELCGPNIHSGPVFWQPDPSFVLIYQMAEKDFLKAFKYDLTTGHVSEAPFLVATGTLAKPPTDGMPGGYSSVSSNGAQNGIVWTSIPDGDAQNNLVPGRLAAFDANSLSQIWSDDDNVSWAKAVPPTIGDGKVFRSIGGLPSSVIVYGLLAHSGTGSRATGQSASAQQSSGSCLSIQQKYPNYGTESTLGIPASDERPVGDKLGGRFQEFKGSVFGMASTVTSQKDNPGDPIPTCSVPIGRRMVVLSSIYWSRNTCAHVVQGEIRQLWLNLGGVKGKLGYPIDDETTTPDHHGRMSRFQHGEIWWYPDKGAFLANSGGSTRK